MRTLVLGALASAGLVLAAVGALDWRNEVSAQRIEPFDQADSPSDLIVLQGQVTEQGQLLTVIDRKRRVLGVYHIQQNTGKIALRSVRNISWDLQLTYLDNEGLLPAEIQSLVESR
jgi:hypothetical protein